MTLEELESLVNNLKSRVDELHDLDFKNITEFEQLPALDFSDSLIAVTTEDYTGKVTLEQIMEYLNKNLKNFICWKPYVENDTLKWERSSNDEAPGEIKFADIMFPMASETDNGMMTSADFIKLGKIDEDNIIYSGALTEILTGYSTISHTHNQYQLKSEMPTKLSEFDNDTEFITASDIPTKISAFENDKKYLVIDDIPNVSSTTRGFMTPEILAIIANMSDNSVTNDELAEALQNLAASFPKNVSALNNDADYMKKSEIFDTFGDLGVVNLIYNSNFQFVTDDVVDNWTITNGNVVRYTEDPSIEYCGQIQFNSDTVLGAALVSSTSYINTVSFIAKSDAGAKFTVQLGDGTAEFNIGTTWTRYTAKIKDGGTNPSMYMTFKLAEDSTDASVLYLANVKVEKGSLQSEYTPSYPDIQKLAQFPASQYRYGAVKPDGKTLIIDAHGSLQVAPSAISNVRIDDETATDLTVYSSARIEELLTGVAPLTGGKISPEYLPEYLDDVLEGTMSIDEGGNYVFTVDAGQYGPAEPTKGIIYLDTESNTAWRWTGSTYMQCTTDKLGGAVMVKYNATDKYMYFVFPE